MPHGWFALFDMAIVGIPVIAWCIWQLVSINREIAKGKQPPDSPQGPGHAIGEHRLDDR